MAEKRKTRIAAVGDIHVREDDTTKWAEYFQSVSTLADVLLLCGDLTDTGHLNEAHILCNALDSCKIPIIAVLGNHDYERNQQKLIKKLLEDHKVHVLDGESVVINDIGFAGVKGFCGGFDKHSLSMFGEESLKKFVEETVHDTLRLDRALAHLDNEYSDLKKVVILHYSPIRKTVEGEPEEIFPFLGSSRLAEPIESRQVTVAFHGHAHHGTFEGKTKSGIPVYNVSKTLIHQQGFDPEFFIMEI